MTRATNLRPIVIYLPYIFGFLALITLILFKLRKHDYAIFEPITTFLNIFALTLLGGIVWREINITLTIASNPQNTSLVTTSTPSLQATTPETIPSTLPDIYYLILDGYSSNSHLSSHWRIDNTEFTSLLEEHGFYVAYDSVSNYTYTHASISSSLNFDYIQNFAAACFGTQRIRSIYGR